MKELLEGMNKIQGDVAGFIAGFAPVKESVEATRLGLEEVKVTQKKQDEWIREVEAKATKRAESAYAGGSALLAAIDTADRREIYIAEAMGKKEPVVFAAKALMIQKLLMRKGASERPEVHARLSKEIDTLQKGFGPELMTQAALSEGTNLGTELILTPVEAEVMRQIRDHSIIRQLARVVPMVSKTHQFPSLDTDVTAAIIAEAGTITDSFAATFFSQKALTAKKIAGRARVSSELLQDSAVALSDLVFTLIAEAVGRLEDTQAFEGDGTGSNFTGVAAAAGVLSVAAGANGDALTYAKMVTGFFTGVEADSRSNAAWVAAPLGGAKIFGLVDTQNMPIWHSPVAGVNTGWPMGQKGVVLGVPCFLHGGILTNRTKGTGANLTNIYYGNWQKLIIGDLLGLTFATDPYSLFTSDEIQLRVTKRTGIVVGVPKAFTIIKDVFTT